MKLNAVHTCLLGVVGLATLAQGRLSYSTASTSEKEEEEEEPAGLAPKYRTSVVPTGRRLARATPAAEETSISSAYLEHCRRGASVTFPVSAGQQGKGVVGLMNNPTAQVALSINNGAQVDLLHETTQGHVFSAM